MENTLTTFTAADLSSWQPSPAREAAYGARVDEAERLAVLATDLSKPPQYECGALVRNRGEALSEPIYWQGRQWAVTPYGVECRTGDYAIEAGQIGRDEGSFGWVQHMAEKDWVDLPDFAEALRIARRRQRC